MSLTRLEFFHEGRYAAEVTVERGEEGAWEPYLSPNDARKLEAVRLALRRGDIAEAAKHGRVFELKPIFPLSPMCRHLDHRLLQFSLRHPSMLRIVARSAVE